MTRLKRLMTRILRVIAPAHNFPPRPSTNDWRHIPPRNWRVSRGPQRDYR